jgi:hypothetical protein
MLAEMLARVLAPPGKLEPHSELFPSNQTEKCDGEIVRESKNLLGGWELASSLIFTQSFH